MGVNGGRILTKGPRRPLGVALLAGRQTFYHLKVCRLYFGFILVIFPNNNFVNLSFFN